jgi:Concanavalin A-like lectin/glucanases superfamily
MPQPPQAYILFDGSAGNFVEVLDPDTGEFSVDTTGELTVAVWMRPDALTFPNTDGSLPDEQYVHWLGKGDGSGPTAQQEWTFRMYSQSDPPGPRANRISFYVFNLAVPAGVQNEGIGSYFQDPVAPGDWIHVVGVADCQRTSIYKNGVLRRCDQYRGTPAQGSSCHAYTPDRWIRPRHGAAPLRIGHRDRNSYFQGAIAEVRLWGRALTADAVNQLYASDVVPQDGLVGEYLLNEGGTGGGNTSHDTGGAATGPHDGTVFGTTWTWIA